MTDSTFEQHCALFAYTPKGRPISGQELAEWLSVHPTTVEGWRQNGTGPKFYAPAGQRRVWYSESDVLKWLAHGARDSTSEHPFKV